MPAYELEIGDIDGDGVPDLVLAGDPMTIALGDGLGGFPTTIAAPIPAATMSLGDLNGDGELDVMAGHPSLYVGLNAGGVLNFSPVPGVDVDGVWILGDLDGDGDIDGAAWAKSFSLVLLVNDGAGVMVPTDTGRQVTRRLMHAADLDSDGDLDLLSVRARQYATSPEGTWPDIPQGLEVLRGAGDGTFTAERYESAPKLGAVAVADFNGDAAPDLALMAGRPSGNAPGGVRLALNDGTGVLARRSYPVGLHPEELTAVDLDGDGDDDLVIANSSSDDASILVNDGGQISEEIRLQPLLGPNSPAVRVESVATADFDGDGRLDLVIAAEKSGSVFVFRGLGGLQFEQLPGVLKYSGPEDLAAGDLDDDGDPDLVVGSNGSGIGVFQNLGDATFSAVADLAFGEAPESVVMADIDGDGRLDLAAAAESDKSIGVARNAGGMTFAPVETYPLPGVPEALVAGDLDGDGMPELIAAIGLFDDVTAAQEVAVLQNDGAGGYDAQALVSVGLRPRALAIGDGDGDGDLDVLVAGTYSDDVTVLINHGGTLKAELVLPVGSRPVGVAFAAIDELCGLDIAVSAKDAGSVLVIPSLGK